jgi:signal transduction histidine kinase
MPGKLRFEVTDTGIGIDPNDLVRIFDAFEQVAPRRQGLGLGLAISKAVVDMHGGKIFAQSQGLGKGSTFIVELPLSNE